MTTTSATAPDIPADPQTPPARLRRLFRWIIPTTVSVHIIWGAVAALLLPLQVQQLDPAAKVSNLAIISAIGATVAMVAQPIAGTISDRTRSRFGRRAPWMVGGALCGGLALVGMSFANTLLPLVIAWVIVQISYNFAQGPLSAVMPDRVPRARRGTFSALMGVGVMLGALGGQVVGAALSSNIPRAYLILSGLAITMLTLFVVFNPDRSSRDDVHPPFRLKDFLNTFWVSPRRHPDFFWAFLGRLLLYTGYFAVTGYQLYILQDFVGLGSGAVALVPVAGIISVACMIIATAVSGPISDRLQRRKVFIIIASVVMGVAFLIPVALPSVTGWIIFSALSGLGFGVFQAVDTAVMSEVLPSVDSFAKDLGVVNIAATLPQAVAPALAGAVVAGLGGYIALFPVGLVLAVAGALAILPIRAVR
ncbi:MFS transporter [Leifsonia sp. AG29]|uniref:MFS transporter n=1 Tax=Leifsonia sp. AG29 TaxID=2598860 RepID=UPI00131C58D9|nr:MFS transporter [Leifsonia sp. AG29]